MEFVRKPVRAYVGVMIGLGVLLSPRSPGLAQDAAPDKANVDAGETLYGTYCAVCHGDRLVSTGQFPNLRRLKPSDRARFESTVHDGRNQMPPWRDVLSDEQIGEIWAYIRAVADR